MKVSFKPVPGFPNYYAGSSGKVYRKKKTGKYKPIKPWHDRDKYANIAVSIKGKKSRQFSHRLIALGFHGKPKKNQILVRHLNGNRTHNVPTNLQWGTYQENWNDRKKHAKQFNASVNYNLNNKAH